MSAGCSINNLRSRRFKRVTNGVIARKSDSRAAGDDVDGLYGFVGAANRITGWISRRDLVICLCKQHEALPFWRNNSVILLSGSSDTCPTVPSVPATV